MSVRTEITEGQDPEITTFLYITTTTISGFPTLFDTINHYDALRTKDKRSVVKIVRKVVSTGSTMFRFQKQLFIFLRWKFECPGCQIKYYAEDFAANEFDLEVPKDKHSKPVLISRSLCECCRS
ncbi:hypothetical protein GGI43DRAFT_384903 [Trichoderma evansii]